MEDPFNNREEPSFVLKSPGIARWLQDSQPRRTQATGIEAACQVCTTREEEINGLALIYMEMPPPAHDPNWRLTLVDVVTTVVSMATTMLYEDENGLLTPIECRINMSQPVSNILSSTLERIRAGYQTGHCSIYLQTYDQSMN